MEEEEDVECGEVDALETFPPQRPGCFRRSSSFVAASQREWMVSLVDLVRTPEGTVVQVSWCWCWWWRCTGGETGGGCWWIWWWGRGCWRWLMWDWDWLWSCWFNNAFCCWRAEICAWAWAWDCWCDGSLPQNCPGGTADWGDEIDGADHPKFHIDSGKLGQRPGNMARKVRSTKYLNNSSKHDASTIHAKVVNRLKGPPSSSQPHKQLSVVRWITCTFEPYQSNQEKETTPGRNVLACNIFHVAKCDKLNSLSNIIEKRRLSRLKSTNPGSSDEMVTPGTAASCFNTHSTDGWKTKRANCYTLLKRITNLKCVNSEIRSLLHSPA